MKNKNALYIVLGIGAGVVAYYLFCKNKVKKGQLRGVSTDMDDETQSTSGGGGFMGGDIAYPMPIVASMETRPLIVNVSTTERTPVTAPITASTTPIRDNVTSASTPVAVASPVLTPISTSSPVSTPVSTVSPVRTPTSTATLSETKLGFEGIGEQCFEVGECLNDL